MTFSACHQLNLGLEKKLSYLASDLRTLLGSRMHALILGGGYGRGEGAVRWTADGPRPYNDLDLFLVLRDRLPMPARLRSLLEHHSQELGIEVDLGRPLTVSDLHGWRPTLMWCELVRGHQVLEGPQDLVSQHAGHLMRQTPQPVEALRLLLNRGAGLLWSRRIKRGLVQSPDPDFLRRNYYKAALALGDALLILHGHWQPRYTGRDQRLSWLFEKNPCPFPVSLYERALRFKLSPDEVPSGVPDLEQLASWWGDVLLYVERRRLKRAFPDLVAYVDWQGLRESEQHHWLHLPRNVLLQAREGQCSWRYPREVLYRQLPVLLGQAGSEPKDWPSASGRFLSTWGRFS